MRQVGQGPLAHEWIDDKQRTMTITDGFSSFWQMLHFTVISECRSGTLLFRGESIYLRSASQLCWTAVIFTHWWTLHVDFGYLGLSDGLASV